MKFDRPLLALLLWACALPSSYSQSLGYLDADNPAEAAGMMQTTLLTVKVLQELCVARFPNLAANIDADLIRWKANEAGVIRKSNAFWAEVSKRDPKTDQVFADIESRIRRSVDPLFTMPGDAGNKVVNEYCVRHFADLASGIWRTRTPKAYTFLDGAP